MTDLGRFRVDGVSPAAQPDVVAFEGGPVFQHGQVLSFDQSITATGWVWVESGTAGVIVRAVGSITCPPDGYPKGHEGTLQRAEYVGQEMGKIVRRFPVMTVVHEQPPVATSKMSRPESSLLTALALRIESRRQGHEIVVVSNQHSKMVLLGKGNGNATKAQWHKALDRYPYQVIGNNGPTNEGQRDALCLALTYLIEKAPE